MKRRDNSYISNHMDILSDMIGNDCIIKAYGNNHLFIENYKNIIEYTDELIRIQGKKYRISINGHNLRIIFYLENDMRIDGNIKTICIG